MRKVLLSVLIVSVFFAAAAVAQPNPPDASNSQGTQSASPSQASPTTPPSAAPGPSSRANSPETDMSSPTRPDSTVKQGDGMKNDRGIKGERERRDDGIKSDKKLKGCIQSSGRQYMLEEKKGKMVNLNSSEDLSAHVGHMVTLHGNWGAKGHSDMSSPSSTADSTASLNHVFYVNSVDMISDTCTSSKGKHNANSNSGSSAQHY